MALSPFEELQYQNRIDDTRQSLGGSLARTQYDYDTVSNRRTRDRQEQAFQYNSPYTGLWQRLPGDFVRRGLFNSGIHKQAANNLAITQARGAADMELSYADQLGGLDVVVQDRVARLKEGGALAGSTLLANEGLRLLKEVTDLPLSELVKVTSWNQACSLNLDHVGRVAAGYLADLVLLNNDFTVAKTFVGGEER